METWTPLFSGIVASSIWGEPYAVRLVWITLLALKDKNGVVVASLPGLARMAVVELAECQEALRVLSSPDRFSKCQEHDGRRIEAIEDGWRVLGHFRNREKMSEMAKREGNKRRQAKFRASRKNTPLRGEIAYVEAVKSGASPERLNEIVTGALPRGNKG